MSQTHLQTRATAATTADGVDAPALGARQPARKRYSAATAARVVNAVRDLERIEDVITLSVIGRRTGVSRATVRAVLRQECGWTPAQSRRAHHAGVNRGKLLQAIVGHPGLAQGRATLQRQGWPNLQRAQQNLRASAYPALQRGRASQAARGWPSLTAGQHAMAEAGYPQLAEGRANLAAREWPNWRLAQDALKAQDYLPLIEAQRLRKHPKHVAPTDLRRARGRTTRLAILEALRALESQQTDTPVQTSDGAQPQHRRVTASALAVQLHLHPSTVYAHLRRLSTEGMLAEAGLCAC